MDLKKELELAVDLAIKAGKEIMGVYNKTFEVECQRPHPNRRFG